jgi:3-oxoacyl-[acyl-carrier protein] reductase
VRRVAITGAAGGIGAALARHFLAEGWAVAGIDRAEFPADLAQAAAMRCLSADVTEEAAIEEAMGAAAADGPLHALIANAAVTDLDHHSALDMPYATWARVLRVNVDGAFLSARAAARRMGEGGNIVFVTSSLARLSDAQAGDAPYCTSKAAVEMLARVLAIELAAVGINVNTLYPSAMIDTGFFEHWPEERRAALAAPSLLNATALHLAGLAPGAATGRSLDQERWDRDAAYRAGWGAA